MPPLQVLHRQAAGLYPQFNPINSAPEGALLEADNCIIDREGILGLRRGYRRFGSSALTDPKALGEFKDKLLALDGTTIKYNDTGENMASWAGTYNPPDANNRIRFREIRDNLYFATDEGLRKNDSLVGNGPVPAGMPQALDISVSLTGSAGWMSPNTQVGYRVVWRRTDASNYLLLGAPSFRETAVNANSSVLLNWAGGVCHVEHTAHGYSTSDQVSISGATDPIYNGTFTITVLDADNYSYMLPVGPENNDDKADHAGTSGIARNVELVFTIPDDIVVGDKWELYRTEASASASADPGDEHKKIKEGMIAAEHLAVGTITHTDTLGESFLGENLYTNITDQTLSQSNDRPPWCTDFTVWKGHGWFANTKREHELCIEITDLTSMSGGTLTFTSPSRTYTGAATEDLESQQFQVHSAQITTAQNIEQTAKSLIRAINRDTGQSGLYAYYISGVNDPPGKILIRKRKLNQAVFTVVASSEIGDNFLPGLSSAVSSEEDAKVNNLQRGKFEQIEASPRLSGSQEVGSEKFKIVRILPLRDSLIVLKEEGIWRVSGESETSFVYKQLDPSTRILCPESAVVLDNAVYCVSNQGVVKVSESGTAIVSRPIEDEFKKLFSFTNFKTLTYAVAYESDRKYVLFTQESSTDMYPKIAWVYDFLTQAWTTMRKNVDVAHVLFGEDKLYLTSATDNFILQERKSFGTSNEDFMDESYDATIDSIGTATVNGVSQAAAYITFPAGAVDDNLATDAVRGYLLEQGSSEFTITHSTPISGTQHAVIFDDDIYDGAMSRLTENPCTTTRPIIARVRWAPEDMGSVALMKHVSTVQIYMEDNQAEHNKVGFLSDVDHAEVMLTVNTAPTSGWGVSEWGEAAWGDEDDASTPLRVVVPRQYQRCRALSLTYEHAFAKERFSILNVAYTFRVTGEHTSRVPA